jgi:signal transduction histidine kinase
MQTLIDALLMLSHVTTKAQPFVTVNLNRAVKEVLSDLEVRLQQTGGKVEVSTLPTLEADPVQMQQLLQNLLSNGLKFHKHDAFPVVKLSSQLFDAQQQPTTDAAIATSCQIVVEDNGIGFEEKYVDRIFNVFQRLHSRSQYEGTGIGLAICRKIVERHRGSITARSTPGQGATFTVTLPIAQPKGDNSE